MNRALRAAAIGVLLIAPVTLSACSAGQVNQTTGQSRDKVGATARVGDITVRAVELAFPRGGSYAKGSDAVLQAAIINSGAKDDTLVSITGDGFTGVNVTGTGSQATVAAGSPTDTGAAATSTSAAPTTSAAATATGTATGTSGAATTTPAPLPTQAPSNQVGIAIPASSVVYLGQNAPHVSLAGLTQSLNAAQSLRLTFTFQRAGAVTVDVIVAYPSSPVPNSSSYDFSVSTKGSVPPNKESGGIPPADNTGGNG